MTGSGVRGLTVGVLLYAPALLFATAPLRADELPFKSAEEIYEELFGAGAPTGSDAGATATDTATAGATRALSELVVPFGLGSSRITADGRRQLDALAAVIAEAPDDARFEVAGHTDASGDAAMNQRLSEARARAVVGYLVDEHGVARARLTSRGYGESRLRNAHQPRSPVNRRVEIRLILG
jgi:outer membrane protein OmpA-like peptidoglycan-associated protein